MLASRKKVKVRPSSSASIEKAEAEEFRREHDQLKDDSEGLIPAGASSEDEEMGYESNDEIRERDAVVNDPVAESNGVSVGKDTENVVEETVVEREGQEDQQTATSGGDTGAGQRKKVRKNIVVPITSEEEERMRQAELEKMREVSGSVTSREAWSEVTSSRQGSAASLLRAPSQASNGILAPETASTHSVITVEEADQDQRLQLHTTPQVQIKSQNEPRNISETTSLDSTSAGKTMTTNSTPSLLAPPEMKGEQQAYVPYAMAKQTIAKVLNDMKNMKERHVLVVTEMTDVFKRVEDQTQGHYEEFVLGLKKQHAYKMVTFRQVIQLQQTELNQGKLHGENVIQSLNAKNKTLMQKRCELLRQSKEGFVKMEAERNTTVQKLVEELDKEKAARKSEVERLLSEHNSAISALNASHELALHEANEKHQTALVDSQQSHKSEIESQVAAVRQEVNEEFEREKKRLEKELVEHRGDGVLKREQVDVVGQLVLTEEAGKEKAVAGREDGSVEVSVEVKRQLEEAKKDKQAILQENTALKARCHQLKAHLEAFVSTTSSDPSLQAQVTEKLEQAETEREKLEEEKQELTNKITEWEEKYRTENDGADPSDEEKTEALNEINSKMDSVNSQLQSVASTAAALSMMKDGEASDDVETPVVSRELDVLRERVVELEEENNRLMEELGRLRQKSRTGSVRSRVASENDGREKQQEVEEDEVMLETVSELQTAREKISELNKQLELARIEVTSKQDEIEGLQLEVQRLKEGGSGELQALEASHKAKMDGLRKELESQTKDIEGLRSRISELEEERLANVSIDAAEEIRKYMARLSEAEKERDMRATELLQQQTSASELEGRLAALTHSLTQEQEANKQLKDAVAKARSDKEKALKEMSAKSEAQEQQQSKEHSKIVKDLERKMRKLEAGQTTPKSPTKSTSGPSELDPKTAKQLETLRHELQTVKAKAKDDAERVKSLEKELKAVAAAPKTPVSAEDKKLIKKQEKEVKELAKHLEISRKNLEKKETALTAAEEELKQLKKDCKKLEEQSAQLKTEKDQLAIAAKEGVEFMEKAKELSKQVASLEAENKTLTENYNSERVLRKKYYNMVEDMKGKIRVYCRSRPLSRSELDRGNYCVVSSPDEYTVVIDTQRGMKEFQFDSIFTEEHSQETVYEDTSRLIQSAVDGYNVCIFAYGQTGSGKTYTMVGEMSMDAPIRGIAPRAMKQIFEVLEENKSKFSYTVSTYMLELYNDRLLDLYIETKKEPLKLDIKKDKKGMVFVTGCVMKDALSAQQLFQLFELGSRNRHTASTKMNAESSRSHLVLGIIIETTNLSNGQVVKGKLSLVDLAGSERAAKTGASAEQLREAQSINKSLSALGDVISALSSEQAFIPYRNNKLTLLMQDSLGGNAKTLMFVNISPADYNCDETVISLTYASRVKLITNDAQKNSENKEIARLKQVIAKLKSGEAVVEEEEL